MTKVRSCHQQTSWKTHQRWQPTACLCTHLKRVKEYVAKLFNMENLPATLELRAPLKVTLNYVTLKASIEAFRKLQAYTCVPKISSHVGSLSFSYWASFFSPCQFFWWQAGQLLRGLCWGLHHAASELCYVLLHADSPIQTLAEFWPSLNYNWLVQWNFIDLLSMWFGKVIVGDNNQAQWVTSLVPRL